MKAELNPYDLPAVLVITDLARALRTSVRTVRRGLTLGTFPIAPMTPRSAVHDPVAAFIGRLLFLATLRGRVVLHCFGVN